MLGDAGGARPGGELLACGERVEQEHCGTECGGPERADGAGGGEEPGAAGGGALRGVELLEVDEQLIGDSEWGRAQEPGSDQLDLCYGGGMLGKSQLGDAFALPGPQQEHGMRVSATLSFHASLTSASEPPPSTPFPLAVAAGLQMRALEVQAVLLVAWSLGWRCVCLVPGWTCAGRCAPLRLTLWACMSVCRRSWR